MENEAEGARVVEDKELLDSFNAAVGCGEEAWKI